LLLAHAETSLPFWHRRLRDAGLDRATLRSETIEADAWEERWASLPILSRTEVQSLDDQLHSRELPTGHGENGEFTTSGSSGRPVRIIRSSLDYFYWQAFQLREHVWRERDLSGTFLSILRDDRRERLDETAHLRWKDDWGPPTSVVWPTGPSVLLDYRAPTHALVDALCEVGPDYLCTFPSLLLEILRCARDAGTTMPPLREAIAVGEATPPELSALCREVWDAPLTSTYTAAETGQIAYRCREEERWHLQSEKAVIEVLDEEARPCAPGRDWTGDRHPPAQLRHATAAL